MYIPRLPMCAAALIFAAGVFGQAPKPTPTPTPTPTVPTNPTRPTTPTQPLPGQQPDSQMNMQRPLFLAGKVSMDDGTSPPDPVTIQLVCRGMPKSVGITDSKGTFSVDLNNRFANAMYGDASQTSDPFDIGSGGMQRSPAGMNTQGGGVSERDLMGCDLQANLAGFRSDVVHLGTRRSLDNPDVGTLILHRLANVEGLTISATSQMAPKDAKKALEKGRNDIKKQKWNDAQRELEKAVDIYPKYAAAWFELGRVQEQQKDIEGARKSYAQSLAADSKYVNPYLQLAALSMHDQKWQDVADETDRMLRLNPIDFPQAWLFNSIANYYLRKMDVAEKSAREGISRDGAHHYPMMNHLLGVILAQKQDYAGAVAQLRDYLHYAPNATDTEEVKKQLAEVEKFVPGTEAQKQ